MEWYTILGLCLGILSAIFMNIWLNRRKWKKWYKVWTDGKRDEDDFTAVKEAVASMTTILPQITDLLGLLKKDEDGE